MAWNSFKKLKDVVKLLTLSQKIKLNAFGCYSVVGVYIYG